MSHCADAVIFKAAQPGDELIAVATPERVGRTLATYRVEVRQGEEKITLFTGTVSRREKPEKRES